MKKSLILKDRFELGEVKSKGIWFRFGDYSVVNFGKLNETHPFPEGVFKGWEAMKDDEDLIRAETWEELKTKLPTHD